MNRARIAAAAALLLASAPGAAVDQAACNLYPTSGFGLYPPKGEDAEFFTSDGGVPNIVFLLDNSGSINRMAPDGAVNTWGSPGPSGFGCESAHANALAYFSPCGGTGEEGKPYSGGVDYAAIASVCPYLDNGNQIREGAPGFDPLYYCPGGGTTCGSSPNFFNRDYVFHDNDYSGAYLPGTRCDTASPSSTATNCKGFEEAGVYPAATSAAAYCNAWNPPSGMLTPDEITARRASCNACLATKGYWYSGVFYRNPFMQGDPAAGDTTSPMACGDTEWCRSHDLGICVDRDTKRIEYNGGDRALGFCRFPHLYFTGNFLNFHPPKYVVLRKVLKDVLMDTRRVRLGLVTFDGNTGGFLQRGLNPSCSMVFPPSGSSFDSNRSSVLNALTAVNFANSTPIAEALLNVGEMYRTKALPWFSSTYRKTSFENAAADGNQAAICFSCQKSSVIVVTDGLSNYDDSIPGLDFAPRPMTLDIAKTPGSYAGMGGYNIKDIDATTCPLCNTYAEAPEDGTAIDPATGLPDRPLANCSGLNPRHGACGGSGPVQNYLPKVAWYLHHMDFRNDAESGWDQGKMAGKQGLDVYTVGYGLEGSAKTILEHAAYRDPASRDKDVGGGISRSASNAAELKQAILDIYEDVNTRATSFGSASVATLQTSASVGTLVPRFDPSKSGAWEGHLYQFQLFSEFSAGCKPTSPTQPLDPNDKDCDRECRSIFLQDKDGSFVQENEDGQFVKNSPPNLPACGTTNRCASCGSLGTTPAEPIWEPGAKLKTVAWRSRRAFTVVDDGVTTPGKLQGDPLIPLLDDATTVGKILPYVNAGGRTCPDIATRLAQAGNTADANAINAEHAITPTREYTTCVRTMIRYALGADVFDADGDGDFLDDRPFKLGDMFHSSPVVAYPPFKKHGPPYAPQYLPTLTEGEGAEEAYEEYRLMYRERHRLVIVGSNDGFLHAFRAATFQPGDDPRTPFDEDGWHDEWQGGDEEWAFMPPDLLPKLPLMLANLHQFYVDSTAFVRDVWVDFDEDDLKDANEYRTVLVMGERRGGNRYFALDLTTATTATDAGQKGKPEFLWTFPQPGAPESLAMGDTFQELPPTLQPTIGPVRMDATSDYAYGRTPNTPVLQSATGENIPFHERWITFLSGGFDMAFARGHGVYMVDVWTGRLVWDFVQPADGAPGVDADDPRRELRFPVAATVGMVGYGKQSSQLAGVSMGELHIFDTASFGDLGGQLWILRFYSPGRIGASGKVENWFGARLLQSGRLGCATASLGQPFFAITANVINSTNGSYRILVGTGDRYNLLDTAGGVCGPENVRACLLRGCTVSLAATTSVPGAVGSHAAAASGFTAPACFPMERTVTAPTGGTCSESSGSVTITISKCANPDPATPNDVSASFSTSASCQPENGTFACTRGPPGELETLRLLNPITQGNRFYSLLVFHPERRPVFDDLPGAKAYDAARLTDASPTLVPIDAVALAPGRVATLTDDGWVRDFTHSGLVTISGGTFIREAIDERVVGGSVVSGGRVFFNTLQPLSAYNPATGGKIPPSPCKPNRAQYSYLYAAMITTGKPGLVDDSGLALIPPIERASAVPPQPPVEHVFVNSAGQVMKGLISQPVGGPPSNLSLGGVEDPVQEFGWISVDRLLHQCRHLGVEASCASY